MDGNLDLCPNCVTWGKGYGFDIEAGGGDTATSATNALTWSFHVIFSGCRAWPEVFFNPLCHQVRTPFEVSALYRL